MVSLEQLQALADTLPPEPVIHRQSTSGSSFDLDDYLARNNVVIHSGPDPYNGGTIRIVQCLFDGQHGESPNDTCTAVIQLPNGAISYACKHNSCQRYKWEDVRELFEPGFKAQKAERAAQYANGDGRAEGNATTADRACDGAHTNGKPEGQHKSECWVLESEATICASEIPPTVYDVEKLLPKEDGPTCLFGPPGSLKSYMVMYLCRCIASGQQFLGVFDVRKYREVIYVNLDAGAKTTRRRFQRLAAGSKGLSNYHLVNAPEFDPAQLRGSCQYV
jgi:hypothetical protein